MKQACADGSVAVAHVRVGHRQTLNLKSPNSIAVGAFFCLEFIIATPLLWQPEFKHTPTKRSAIVKLDVASAFSLAVKVCYRRNKEQAKACAAGIEI